MLGYFIKRLFFFVPTLILISMVAFGLSKLTPGDPLECGSGLGELGEEYSTYSKTYKNAYLFTALNRGLDIPSFYFNINPLSHPDTLYKIIIKEEREHYKLLINKWGNWPAIQNWLNHQEHLALSLEASAHSFPAQAQIEIRRIVQDISLSSNHSSILKKYKQLATHVESEINIARYLDKTIEALESIFTNFSHWKSLIPSFHWYGFNNQYHHWIGGILVGDFGISCRNGLPAFDRIKKSIFWTLMLSIPSIFLAFLLAIPLGVFAGMNPGSKFDRNFSGILFFLYSLPAFWLGTMLIAFLTTPEYSRFLDWFPSVGIGNLPSSAPFWDRFWESAGHLILPIFCSTYINVAFIYRQMRNSVLDVIPQDYVLTAKAKGLGLREVMKKHVFRNAIFPVITIIGAVLPAAISGSIIIEVIFNIPGMGRETLSAINNHDWPIVYIILFIGAGLTLLGLLLADLLYAWLDPRITFSTDQKQSSN